MFDKLQKLEEISSLKVNLKKTSKYVGNTMFLMLFFSTLFDGFLTRPFIFLIISLCFGFSFLSWYADERKFVTFSSLFVILEAVICLILNLNTFFLISSAMLNIGVTIALYFSKKHNSFCGMIASSFIFSFGIICLAVRSFGANVVFKSSAKNDDLSVFYILVAVSSMFKMILSGLYLFRKIKYKKSETFLFKKLNLVKTFNMVCFGVLCCFVAQITTAMLIELMNSIGIRPVSQELPVKMEAMSLFLYFFSVSVIPALTEEFAFRGIIFNSLRKYGTNFALVTQAILFGLIHVTVHQVFFAFVVGLILGFMLIKTNSMLPGMIVHFFNNFFACVLSTFSKINKHVSSQIGIWGIVAIVLLGILSLVILIRKDKSLFKVKNESVLKIKTSTRIFFSTLTVVMFNIFIFTLMIIITSTNKL